MDRLCDAHSSWANKNTQQHHGPGSWKNAWVRYGVRFRAESNSISQTVRKQKSLQSMHAHSMTFEYRSRSRSLSPSLSLSLTHTHIHKYAHTDKYKCYNLKIGMGWSDASINHRIRSLKIINCNHVELGCNLRLALFRFALLFLFLTLPRCPQGASRCQ